MTKPKDESEKIRASAADAAAKKAQDALDVAKREEERLEAKVGSLANEHRAVKEALARQKKRVAYLAANPDLPDNGEDPADAAVPDTSEIEQLMSDEIANHGGGDGPALAALDTEPAAKKGAKKA